MDTGFLAQQVEHIHGKDGVCGSSPQVGSSNSKGSLGLREPLLLFCATSGSSRPGRPRSISESQNLVQPSSNDTNDGADKEPCSPSPSYLGRGRHKARQEGPRLMATTTYRAHRHADKPCTPFLVQPRSLVPISQFCTKFFNTTHSLWNKLNSIIS